MPVPTNREWWQRNGQMSSDTPIVRTTEVYRLIDSLAGGTAQVKPATTTSGSRNCPTVGTNGTNSALIRCGDGMNTLLEFVAASPGANNETATINLWGWRPAKKAGADLANTSPPWIPRLIGSMTLTVGSGPFAPAAAVGEFATSDLPIDTITVSSDRALPGTALRVLAPRDADGALITADNRLVGLFLDSLSYPFLEVELTGGTGSYAVGADPAGVLLVLATNM